MLAKTKFPSFIFVLLGAIGGATALDRQAMSQATISQPQSDPKSCGRDQDNKDNRASGDKAAENEAKALLAKAIKAHGGQKTLEKFPCVRLEMKVVLPGHSPSPKDWVWLFAAPDRLKEVRESSYMGRRRDSVWIVEAGEAFKLHDGITLQPVSAKLAVAFQDDVHLMQVLRLVPLMDKQYELAKTADINVDGKPALGLRVHTKGQHDVTLFFDAESGLLVKVQRNVMDTSKLEIVAEQRFYQNYRKQDGLQFAGTISVIHDGLKDLQIEIKEAKFMEKVEDAEFLRK